MNLPSAESTSSIEAVVFDVGGVLMPTPFGEFDRIDAEYDLRPGTTMDLFRGGSLFAKCEIGELSFADFCIDAIAQIRAEQGVAVPAERLDKMMWTLMGGQVSAGMIDLVTQIKAAGLRTALLSNVFAERHAWLSELFPAGAIDLNCSSYVVGLRKPEVAIYREMLTRLDLSPHQVAFVDDFPENVEAARAVGIHGLLFLGEAECRRQLHALGVPVTMT